MSQFRVYVTPEALAEIKDLPGHARQRIRQSIKNCLSNHSLLIVSSYGSTILIASYSAFAWITGELFMRHII